MFTKSISFENFKTKINTNGLKKKLQAILYDKNEIINSLKKNYKYSFNSKKIIKKYNRSNFRIIGMGGSILGTQTIYDFLKNKIKKKIIFIDNLQTSKKKYEKKNIQI